MKPYLVFFKFVFDLWNIYLLSTILKYIIIRSVDFYCIVYKNILCKVLALHLIFKFSDINYSFFECWSFTCRKQVLYLVIFDRITAHLEMNTEGNNFIDEIASYLLVNINANKCVVHKLWIFILRRRECITDKIW